MRFPSIAKAALLAITSLPLSALATLADELDDAVLAKMSEASSVRVGCGVSQISFLDPATSLAGSQANDTLFGQQSIGVILATILTAVAIRMCPQELRHQLWVVWNRTAIVLFLASPYILWLSPLSPDSAGIAWGTFLVSTFIALPIIVRSALITTGECFRLGWMLIGRAFDKRLYISVVNDAVTLRQGNRIKQRLVSARQKAETSSSKQEAEKCLSR